VRCDGTGGNQTNTINQSYCTQGTTGLAVGTNAVLYSSQRFYGPNTKY